jgi:nucleotide-binding universal stress UspA family protein
MTAMNDPILVTVDGSRAADAGLAYALGLACALKARVVLLHVIDVEPHFLQTAVDFDKYRTTLREYGEQMLAKAAVAVQDRGLQVSYALRETEASDVASVIVAEAATQRCGLIVLGTHGRRSQSRPRLGRDAELVLRDSPVPVLFVRSTILEEPGSSRHGDASSDQRTISV